MYGILSQTQVTNRQSTGFENDGIDFEAFAVEEKQNDTYIVGDDEELTEEFETAFTAIEKLEVCVHKNHTRFIV